MVCNEYSIYKLTLDEDVLICCVTYKTWYAMNKAFTSLPSMKVFLICCVTYYKTWYAMNKSIHKFIFDEDVLMCCVTYSKTWYAMNKAFPSLP